MSINPFFTSLKKKVPQLLEALDGYFSDHHRGWAKSPAPLLRVCCQHLSAVVDWQICSCFTLQI
ncbi:hypothetical protein SSUR61_2324 [Streptococcus suis R61]|uniref:Uncharacterized protein n=1 Tax=Streptococcus suis R61 TaxID=996306 RepID=A0AA87K2Y2_STRSU|nr:hypothetical protein SSUR61_2324 [Streptococcus suis R61]